MLKLKWGFSLGPLINVTFVLYKNANHLTILFKSQSICLGIFCIFAKCIILEIRADLILVSQSCPALCNSMDCSPPGPLSMGFPRQEYSSEQSFPSPVDLHDPGIESRFPTLQVDSVLSETPGKP